MSRRFSLSFLGGLMAAILVLFGASAPSAWAQAGSQGTVTVTVLDQSGGVVSGAQLQIEDIATNDVRNAVTQDRGTYSFVNLIIGTYKLTITKTGFQTQVFDKVTVQAAQVTDIPVTLKVGETSEKVEVVENATPLVDTTSNTIATTIDMKMIENLPLGGRDLTALTFLVPGFTGTWNGLPVTAQGNNVDGVDSSTNRMKFSGTTRPDVTARIENIQEMTVQTDQIDANQGFGQAAMQINYVTRRGTNSFHGRAFEDHQDDWLNANSWTNDAQNIKKGKFILNDFGGDVGGPILKNKLFFFADFSMNKNPGSPSLHGATVLNTAAQQGNYTYVGTDGTQRTLNVYNLATAYNSAHPGTNLPVALNSIIGNELSAVNGSLQYGQLTTNAPGDLNSQTINWRIPQPVTYYFPAARLDYNFSQNFRVNFALEYTKQLLPNNGTPALPGPTYSNQTTNAYFKDYTTALGFDWTISPTLINSFRGGYLYHFDGFTAGADQALYPLNTVNWAYGVSGVTHQSNLTDYYPTITGSDTLTWQHGAHTWNFGFSYQREQDHYWNAPSGWNNINLGLANLDPALGAFTNTAQAGPSATVPFATNGQLGTIQALYATLVGRINGANASFAYNIKTGQYDPGLGEYPLDELQRSWGLFAQDSYRLRTNLTLNYALRWDFTGDDHDLTNQYHGAATTADMFGSSGIGNLFNPGVFQGDPNPLIKASSHQYHSWNKSPQPSIGIAWNPQYSEGILGKLSGGGQTVIRAGFQFRNFTEPYQYFWDNATDYGAFYYQLANINPRSTPGLGNFVPGSLTLGDPLPAYFKNPPVYSAVVPMANQTFHGQGLSGFNQNIKQPYNQAWNLGFQRQLGKNNAIEIRYEGGRSVHQWASYNLNEVNIFGNWAGSSFLDQFKQAQTNLALNSSLPGGNPYAGTFAYDAAVPGEAAIPMFATAFQTETPVNGVMPDYSNGQYTGWLNQGQAGAFATELANPDGPAPGYFCNLVGTAFSPCVTTQGATNPGIYPSNIFQVNPYFSGNQYFPNGAPFMTNGAYSTYEGLIVDFRQKQWHGMQFDANYAYSQNLADGPFNGSWTGQYNEFTLRNLRLGYTPTPFDYHHVIHANGTYDLPFGKGKEFLNRSGLLDRLVGGWTVGTIFSWQSGLPFSLGGGFNTFNDFADGGVNLVGITRAQLQNAMGLYRVTPATYQANGGSLGAPFVLGFNPNILATAVGGNIQPGGSQQPILTANTSPGTLNPPVYLIGPRFWNDDLAVTKAVTIRENLRFTLQGEFLNAFNHVNFGNPGSFAQDSTGFGQEGPANGPRSIEFRANLEF